MLSFQTSCAISNLVKVYVCEYLWPIFFSLGLNFFNNDQAIFINAFIVYHENQ